MRRALRALGRLFVALVALLTARSRSEEGVTSGPMAVEDTAKVAEAQARAAEARARAAEAELKARGEVGGGGGGAARTLPEDVGAEHPLPDADTARAILQRMLLIRRFEERAGEMYTKAKIGGFLHLCIGEEATIVGSVNALAETDYLISTYREHGQALARGTEPNAVMAELFGKQDGCSGGRGGSMHLFDLERRFMGGYGIVGGNLPIAAGLGLASSYRGDGDVTLCMMGDGA